MKNISIAMATYNGAKFIREQLDSFAKQTRLPDELIVCDDCSPDDTLAIIADFATTASFPVHFEKNEKQLGYRGNFMKAASLCKSDLISFSDQDDVWLPTKLEKCAAAFEDPDVLLTYHNATVVDGDLDPIGTTDHRAVPQPLNPPLSIGTWHSVLGFTLVFRRSLLRFNDLWPQSTYYFDPTIPESHDDWFFFLASCLGTVAYIAEPLALYRQHGKNVFGWQQIPADRTLWDKFASINMDEIKLRKISAGSRASILEMAAQKLNGNERRLVELAAARCRQLEHRYRLREGMYASSNPLTRLNHIVALLRTGAYVSKNQFGFGRQALVKDVARSIAYPVTVIPSQTTKDARSA